MFKLSFHNILNENKKKEDVAILNINREIGSNPTTQRMPSFFKYTVPGPYDSLYQDDVIIKMENHSSYSFCLPIVLHNYSLRQK